MTDRRHFLTAALIAPVVISAPAIAAPEFVCAPASPSAELLALITEYRAKADACTAHTCNVYSPTHSAWQAEVEAIPHLTTKTGYQYLGEVHQLSTDRRGHVAAAKSAAKLAPGGLWSAEYEACCAELRDLVAKREAQQVALDLKYQINALGNENDRLGDVAYDVLCEIEDFPSRTIADLLTKLDLIDETAGQLDIDMVRRDLRRIAGEAVA
ncbi:hypothetical protein N6H05_07545 [Sphingobium sp. WTD-1]|uniref:hypothetical protein n=1 Tax=Sphingobium sp. WTD-1 TaxID=2979467 RepID=UPI0024DE872A|nr:hypothetical protein [Sphingobium sp. WTD-1]WIA57642.1 hypothetical protein N6H05_07545 [Sphingobium sp. WTD-1]